MMLVGFSLPVLLEAVALKKAPPKKMMLVGFYLPVQLSGQQRGGLKCKKIHG